ncbi:uncharacterized protein LOC105224034 [Bactrocera dorsalis]|uniref:Uncharacterized protein LOC105224034 n=1 Tax=Bactrocera dorsalis TaxID=27457 RepID=A0A6I9UZJ6_BACDO|nr:uncharacterized protein LOC105224034 [Bactrocera dorsalis]
MKLLVLFAATLLCVQAYHIPYGLYDASFESSEEEYQVLVKANNQPPLSLPGVGVYNQPILQAVKVKVPRYVSPELKQQIITQTLAARGLTLHTQPPQGALNNVAPTADVRPQREVPATTAAANKGAAVVSGTDDNNVVLTAGVQEASVKPAVLSTSVVPEAPVIPVVPMML